MKITSFIILCTLICFPSDGEVRTIDIEPVWAGHPVGFCLLTHAQDQFAAYYLICVLGMEMLEEARRQQAIADRAVD